MNVRKLLFSLSLLIVILSLSSCIAAIEDTAANSAPAVIAAIGEYLLAIISVLLVYIFHFTRALSFSVLLLGYLGSKGDVALPVSPSLLLVIGIIMLLTFAIPIKTYNPKIIIAKNVKKVIEKENKEDSLKGKSMIIDLVVGIILLIIEYLLFK